MMRVLVCGSRNWTDKERIYKIISLYNELYHPIVVIHGDAKGADTIAKECSIELGIPFESYPADWNKYGRSAGPRRNRKMLDTNPDTVIAFHDDLYSSKGTLDMVTRSRKKGTTVLVYQSSIRTTP